MPNPTPTSPVGDYIIESASHNPFNLTVDMRCSLSTVFCNSFHYHKSDYVSRKRNLSNHLAVEDRDEKHDAVLISLCDFSERGMRETAQIHKSILGSNFWLEELEAVIAENSQLA